MVMVMVMVMIVMVMIMMIVIDDDDNIDDYDDDNDDVMVMNVDFCFSAKRVTYLNVFMNNIGGSLVSKIFPVETDYKGQISSYSIEKLKSLEFATENLIVLIYEEDDLPHFFQLVRICNFCIKNLTFDYKSSLFLLIWLLFYFGNCRI